MSDKSFEWKTQLEDVILSLHDSDSASKVADLRDALTSRLRIMGPTDHEERAAIEEALAKLEAVATKH
jgi:hypothetical protein